MYDERVKDYNLIEFDVIDSTNEEAVRLAKAGTMCNHIITAKSQQKGRGSKGREWVSDQGNLYMSILLADISNIAICTVFPFLTANVVADILSNYTNDIKLKWPNDILLNGKKIAGILVESITVEDVHYVIIGLGVNINNHPNLKNYKIPITSLRAENITIKDQTAFLDRIIEEFNKTYYLWQQDKDFDPIKRKWLSRAYKLGANITISDAGKEATGKFCGIDSYGRLMMSLPNSDDIVYYSNGDLI